MLRNRQQIMWDRWVKCCIYLLKERNRTNSFATAVKRANTSKKSRRNFTKHPHWSHLLFGRLTQEAPLLWHSRRGRRGTLFALGEVLVLVLEKRLFGGGEKNRSAFGCWESDGRRQGGRLEAAGAGLRRIPFPRDCASPPRPAHEPAGAVLSIISRSGTRTRGSLVPSQTQITGVKFHANMAFNRRVRIRVLAALNAKAPLEVNLNSSCKHFCKS